MNLKYGNWIEPDSKVDLSKISPLPPHSLSEEEAKAETVKLHNKLGELQEFMYAAGTQGTLVVLQGMDTSGKDGTIRKLSTCLNVQSCQVSSFKVPTELEQSHDFLWRIHSAVPKRGNMAIFNRSHYEDVIVVRVHDLVAKKVWEKRYDRINAFEKLLFHEASTIIVKFFLHISKEEQEERLRAREQESGKEWKLSSSDWKERTFWDKYQSAFESALENCSTKNAPWVVVPADKKWFRDLVVAEALVKTLEPYEKAWKEALQERGKKEMAELAQIRK